MIATIAVTGAGTVDAEPRSIHESIGIDTLGSADPSTLSKPTRKNVKDCSEAVAGANLPNAILTGCNLAGANLTRREPVRREPDRREPDRREPGRANLADDEPDPGGT